LRSEWLEKLEYD